MRQLFRQFSFPGGIPSHVAPETPGSIHEGGELGYALVARLRRRVRQPGPRRRVRRRRRRGRDRPAGDELALEQVPQPARRDGAVLPILHLNGYKIANPTVLARIPDDGAARAARRLRLRAALRRRRRARADAPAMAGRARRGARRDRRDPAGRARRGPRRDRPRWPMIVLRTPKGWTGPKEVDGKPVEGTWRSHQVPLAEARDERRAPASCSRTGCGATGRRSSSTTTGALVPELARARPRGRPPDEREPARERRPAAARPRAARLPRLRGRGRDDRARRRRRRRGCSARSCAT